MNNRKFPTFHIAEKDKVYVYQRSFTKNSIVGICSVDNCDARCKIMNEIARIEIANEILLISKDPNRRRLQLDNNHEGILDIRFGLNFNRKLNFYCN